MPTNLRILLTGGAFWAAGLLPAAPAQAQIGGLLKKAQTTLNEGVKVDASLGRAKAGKAAETDGAEASAKPAATADKDYDRWVYDRAYAARDLLRTAQNAAKHAELAATLDLPATLATLQKKGKPGNPTRDYDYKTLLSFQDTYTKLFEEEVKPYANQLIEKAYQLKARSPKEAISQLEEASTLSGAALRSLPDYQPAQALKQDVDKALASIGGSYYAGVYTSPFHKQNAGKVLFSKSPIIIGKENPAQFTTQFAATDKIYAVAYLKGSIKDLAGGETKANYQYSVDGAPLERIDFRHNAEDLAKSYYLIEILPAPEHATHTVDAPAWAEALGSLSPRPHQLKIELTAPGYWGEPFAGGSISLDLSNANPEQLKATAAKAAAHAKASYVNPTKVPEEFGRASRAFQDPQLSAANLKAAIEREWSCKVLKLVIEPEGSDWHIDKNNLGLPTKKVTNGHAHVLYKDADGNCRYVVHLGFRRDYEGGDSYGPVQVGNGYGTSSNGDIDCAKIK